MSAVTGVRDPRRDGQYEVYPARVSFLPFLRLKRVEPARPAASRTQLSYLCAQLRMSGVTRLCVSPSSGSVHPRSSWSTRFLSASTWTSGGGIITGTRAHTHAHAHTHRKQTEDENREFICIMKPEETKITLKDETVFYR